MASTPAGGTPPPTALPTGLPLGPLDNARFAPGHLFASRYRIVSLLGRGAMGEVYRADDLRVGQVVALKLMSDAMARRHDGLERLTGEVRLARGIAHPNVCRVYDIGLAEGWHYLSMEFVDGETLASLLRRIGQPPPAKAIEMARQLCAGVAAAHERGVLHRDLKPSNIMLDGRGQIRILDFGLAVAAVDDVREVAGTPAYMPPEQLAGGQVTVQSDLYALGRVLSEILPPGVDARTSAAVDACLAADPSLRPRSAYAVLTALPSGDARVLIDGGILTPAMVAATPTCGTLSAGTSWLLLATAIAGAFVVGSQAGALNVRPSQVPKPPEVLAERAREILTVEGRPDPVVDRAFWWSAAEGDDEVRFTYRESSNFLIPANMFRAVTTSDPPATAEGMRMVTLSADGIATRNDPPARGAFSSGRSAVADTSLWIAVLFGFAAGSILATRNLRAGEGDRNGALKLSLFVVLSSVAAAALRAHHVPSVAAEAAWLLGAVGWAVIWGGFSWLAYVSFEPYIRRWWPLIAVSWTRLLAGQVRDPLVGRELLIGTMTGVISAAILLIPFVFTDRDPPGMYVQPALDALQSPAAFTALLLLTILNGVLWALGAAATLVLLRLFFRRTAAAIVAQVLLGSLVFANPSSATDVAHSALVLTVSVAVLLRVGVLAFVALLTVRQLLAWMPLTLDGDAWYFERSLIVLLVISGLAAYGFLVSLGGRPAFGTLARDWR